MAQLHEVFPLSEALLPLSEALLAEQPSVPTDTGISGAVGDALFASELRAAGMAVDPSPWIERASRDAYVPRRHPGLHLGKAGLGFVRAAYGTDDSGLAELDRELGAILERVPVASIQSGVAGFGLYASLRSGAASGRDLQRAVVARLRACAVPAYGGVVWHTPPEYANDRGVATPATPVTEFGMIHGIGGALASLTALAVEGNDDAAELVRASLRALWNLAADGPNHFGRILFGEPGATTSHEFEHHRWCIGDVGVLRACYVAGRAIGDSASSSRAQGLLRVGAEAYLSGRLPGEPGRRDLCCGAASFGQVYWRMHQETADPVFRAANERIVAGCVRVLERIRASNFLFGRMGIVLTALTAARGIEPIWDGILGISLPRAARARAAHVGSAA